MMKRHAIQVFWGSVLMLLVVGGTGADRSWAANGQAVVVPPPEPTTVRSRAADGQAVVVPPPAPVAVSSGGPKATTAPATVSPAIPKVTTAPAAVSSAVPAARTTQTASLTPAAVPTPAPPAYRYQAEGKADPFVPFMELDLAVKKQKEEALKKRASLQKVPVSPLQQADIGRFHLVGIAGDELKRMAIVEDSVAKKYYPLLVGTNIGLNGGRVVSILPDRVIVEERLQDETKKVRKTEIRRIPIMLHKEEEGRP